MAFDQDLALRVRHLLEGAAGFSERRMFGGICFLLDGRMSAGVLGNELIVRVSPDEYEEAMRAPGARPMDFTGRPMRGFLDDRTARIQDPSRHVGVAGPKRGRRAGGREAPHAKAPGRSRQGAGALPRCSSPPAGVARPLNNSRLESRHSNQKARRASNLGRTKGSAFAFAVSLVRFLWAT